MWNEEAKTLGQGLLHATGLAGQYGVTVTSSGSFINVMLHTKIAPSTICFIIEKAVGIGKDDEYEKVRLIEYGIVVNTVAFRKCDMHKTESKELVLMNCRKHKANTLRLTFEVSYGR